MVFNNLISVITQRSAPTPSSRQRNYQESWRPSDGMFYVRRSSDGGLSAAQWGLDDDVPIVGDYDGDGKADHAVFRPSSGNHFVLKSSDGTYIGPIWGVSTDMTIAARYIPEQ